MVRTKLNRLTAMLLSFIMILSSFSVLTAVEAKAATDKITLELNDTNIKWAKTVTFYEPFSKKNYTHWQGQMRHTLRIKETGKVAYCIQPGTYMYDFVQQIRPTLSVGEADAWDALGDEKKSAIKLIMYFGYPNKHIYLSGTDAEQEIATQLIIWEIVCGYRDPNNYNLTDDRFAKGMFGNSYEQNQGVFTAYDKIVDSMIGYNKIISFSTPQSRNAPTYTMNWDGTKYTVTLTDKNNVLGKYTLTCSNPNVRLTVSGNQLIVSSTEPISGNISVKARTTASSENNNVIAYGHFNSEIQEVIDQSTSDLPDPVFAYLNVKTQATGALKVQKQFRTADDTDLKNTIENSVLVNTKFLIRNSADKYIKASYPGSGTLYHYSGYTSSSSEATAFTLKNISKSFYFDVDKLPAGTYTVIEQDTSTTGFTVKGSKSVKVTVTANNSGGIKTAQFENQPSQLVINKTFRKYGAVTDDDYKDVTVEIAQNNSSSPIKAVCIDTENNVYQYVSVSKDSVYSGKAITDQLVFYNPKVHSITIIGLPIKNSSGTYYQYTAKEKDTGRISGRNIAKRYIYNNVSKTFQTGVTQSDTLTNTERSIGYIEIEKDFEIENTDGSHSEFTGSDKLTLTEAYNDISFLVKNAAGKYLKANFIGNQYMYSSLVNTSAEATKFSFYAGNKTKIRIINLPFGTYHVTEVIGSKVKGQGFREESNGQKTAVTYYNVSADEVVGGHTKFVNVKPQYVGLRIYKTFTDTDGENVDVSQKIYRQLSFSLSDENGSRIPVVLDNSVQGTYHPFRQGNGETPRETMQLGTSTHTITITGLESGKTYLVRERIAGTELKKICVCKSSFTVEGTKENKAVFADEDAVVLGNTVTMPTGEHSTAEVYFENTYSLNDLPYGEYVLTETKAPAGHVLTEKVYPFRIIDNGVTVEVNDDGEIGIPNNPIEGYIKVIKKDKKADIPVEGAEFTLYDSKEKVVKKVTTDKEGVADFGKLVYGKYTVKETTAPKHYVLDDTPIPFEILEHGKTYSFTQKETPKPGYGYLKKTSEDGVLKGFKFHIYGTSDSGNKVDQTLTTNDKGEIRIELFEGTYTVEEVDAPDRYLSTAKQTVKIISDKTTEIKFDNKLKKGNIEILKLDGTTQKPLAGAEFTLYNSTGEVVQKVTSDEEGKAVFSDLPYGEYNVVETKAPAEYEADSTPIPFSIVEHGKTLYHTKENTPVPGHGYLKKTSEDSIVEGFKFHVYGTSDTGVAFDETITTDGNGEFSIELLEGDYTVEEVETPDRYIQPDKQSIRIESGKTTFVEFDNRLKKGNIEIIKIDEITRKPLAGAEFTLFDAEDNAILVMTTDENGKVTFENVPYGDYHVAETKAPDDYVLDSTPIPFSVIEDGMLIALEKENTPDSGSIEIVKESEDGVIENVGFHIFGTAKNGVEINETVYTDKEGKFLMDNLIVGTYTIEEIEMPDRYIAQEPKTVEVIANEKTVVTFENHLKKGSVTTTKVDAEYPDHKLSGAVFEIFDADYNSVGLMEEIETGIYRLDNLIYGKYILKEIEAPEYYELDTNEYPFEITENGDVRNIETLAGVGFINNAQRGSLVITKRSSDNKLEGFSFRITGKAFTGQEYDEVFATDKDGKITVEGLRVGSYTVSEISDETNVRYILPDDKEITIPANNTAEIEMFNDEKTIPFEITKKDISTGELIPDCAFRIRNSDGEIVVEGRTDKDGIAKFELVCGDYTYQEFDAPEGYIIDTKEYPFSINPDDTIVKAEMTNVGTGTIEITKKDISTGELIPDCGIEILDENKEVILQGRTDANGDVSFAKLPYGKYYYREFDAPEGYVLDETPYLFEIKENGEIVKATMTNKPIEKEPGYITTDKPKEPDKVTVPTGDNTNFIVVMLVLVAGLSFALMIFNIRASRKRNNKN